MNIVMKYCSGKHKCGICGEIYDCPGETSLHDGNTNSGRCMGDYESVGPNHTLKEHWEYLEKCGML